MSVSSRANSIDVRRSVNDILREYPAAIAVLHARRIDSCCRGHLTLADAAASLGLDAEQLASEIIASA